MKVSILSEAGYTEAALGFSLSYNTTIERAKFLLPKYAFKQGGENKFLESMLLWVDVTAPRFWWQEADTYRVGVTKQSESTMHTICKHTLTQDDFEYIIAHEVLDKLNELVYNYSRATTPEEKVYTFGNIKNHLPEGFLQRRVWMMSYKTLQNIFYQRRHHRLPQWQHFLDNILAQIKHPEFIISERQETEKEQSE